MPYSTVMAVLLAATVADPGAASAPNTGPTTRETRSELAFPYTVFVETPEAELRAGPGTDHYVTNRLERGTRLEVYRHDPGGWFAVRPPLGSFSWVEADKLRMTDEPGVAEVTGDEVHSWVGTTEQVPSHSWQVRLKGGELVEVLGVKQFADAATGQAKTWYRIAPPAGEFRWINGLAVSHTLPEIATGASGPNGGSAAPTGSFGIAAREPSAWRAPGANQEGPTSANLPLTGTFEEQLDQLEVDVSLMAARDAQQWDFAPLRQQAERLVDSGATAVERGKSRLLLSQIEQFDDLQRRREVLGRTMLAANQSIPGAMFRETSLTAEQPSAIFGGSGNTAGQAVGTGVVDESGDEVEFDATGWLVPVHSLVPGAPPYALVNEENTTLSYLTPAPGRNLHRYLGRPVGVIGERSYVPHLDAPHVMVRRMVDLDRQSF